MHGLLADRRAAGRKRLLIGSHIDTVVDAGRYDGNLGVVAGDPRGGGNPARGSSHCPSTSRSWPSATRRACGFPKTLFGSSTVAGVLEPAMLELVDASGVRGSAMRSSRSAAIPRPSPPRPISAPMCVGYLEVHIEQGPVLEQGGEALGVVSAIASQGRYRLHGSRRGGARRHRADGDPPRRAGRRGRNHGDDRGGRPRRREGVAGRDRRRTLGLPGRQQRHSRRGSVQPRCPRRERRGADCRGRGNPQATSPDRRPSGRCDRHGDGSREAGRRLRAASQACDRCGRSKEPSARGRAS